MNSIAEDERDDTVIAGAAHKASGSQDGSKKLDKIITLKERFEDMKERRLLPRRRTAMGSYIVPPGEKPLTSLGDCNPSPSDYYPKDDLTKTTAPQVLIVGRTRPPKAKKCPGPADYDTSTDMEWRDKFISQKNKGRMCIYDIRSDAHINDSIGPSRYNSQYYNCGTMGPRYTVRAPVAVPGEPPNRLVQPVDTHGVNNPGPGYRPSSKYWGRGPEKSFGCSRKDETEEGPGPAEYTVSDEYRGPAYSLAQRLPSPKQWKEATSTTDNPAPNAYDLGTTVGETVAISITGRPKTREVDDGPAPNMYTLPNIICQSPTAKTLAYRWFEIKEAPQPSPAHYSLTDTNLKRSPAYTCAKRTSGNCFLPYELFAPGPGSYDPNLKYTEYKAPAFSVRERAKSPKHQVPGPAHYSIKLLHKPDAKKAPGYTMAQRFEPPCSKVSPGPAAYSPKVKDEGPRYSMTKRHQFIKKFETPSPNAYRPKSSWKSRKGRGFGQPVTLKSRFSPYVYSGFCTKQLRDPVN
ncbi:uncharacterized protein LOC106154883 [Lingula anatina]|uniref:Uncharacterized protein LOC106154883 n=1 Tax=Lingula anatina TaxID=7574 RepID=A0A1S3HFP6_LINAN|nr:uncharacterized protein LOC106154883 [Lingula anatina]|eukprot:XP_013384875.1 uncharacterized protein LOC106154883 [Lingula anatina]